MTVPLFADSLYEVFLVYGLSVPFGTDPSTSLSLSASLTPVPEPSSVTALMFGLLVVGSAIRPRG